MLAEDVVSDLGGGDSRKFRALHAVIIEHGSDQEFAKMQSSMSANVPPISSEDQKTALELEKLRADIGKARADQAKAELEALELKRWYRRPAVMQPWAAIVLAFVTAVIAWANGWFSTKIESLTNQQAELQRKNESLQKERDQLQISLRQTASQAQQFAREVGLLKPQAEDAQRSRMEVSNLQRALEDIGRRAESAANTGLNSTTHPTTILPTYPALPPALIPVAGVVRSERGVPLQHAQVWAEGTGNIGTIHGATAFTDQTGAFYFTLRSQQMRDVDAIHFHADGFSDIRLRPDQNVGTGDYSSLSHLAVKLPDLSPDPR